MRFPIVIVSLVLSSSMFSPVFSAGDSPENLALNKPYTFSVKPNYGGCTDQGDMLQLTDGKSLKTANNNNVGFLLDKGNTVGWQEKKDVEITIDLGEIKPISGFSFNTTGGNIGGGVNWPPMIKVLVSDDNKDFFDVVDLTDCNLAEQPLQEDGCRIYTYRAENLKTKGRYVKFHCYASPAYIFCDEIQVFAGPNENMNAERPAAKKLSDKEMGKIFTVKMIKRRMLNDIIAIRKLAEKSKLTESDRKQLLQKLAALRQEALNYEFKGDPADFKAVIPENELHAAIIALYSQVISANGFPGLTFWHKNRYERLAMFELPGQAPAEMAVRMMNGESRGDVLNITNANQADTKLTMKTSGVPQCFRVYQIEGVDTKQLVVSFSAMLEARPAADGSYAISVPAGMTRQLWFSFRPENVAPGIYKGEIKFFSGVNEVKSVPVTLTVSPVKYAAADFKSLLWDYATDNWYAIKDGNRAQAVAMMKEYLTNVAVGNRNVSGLPEAKDVDASGNLLGEPDFSNFDKWIQAWSGAKIYHIFLHVTSANQNFAGAKPGSPEFNNGVGQWVKKLSEHAKSKGLKPSQIQLNILDEPQTNAHYDILEKWIAAVKAANTGITIFSDPSEIARNKTFGRISTSLKDADVICSHLVQHIEEYNSNKDIRKVFEDHLKKNGELWLYFCIQPNRDFDPSYFRLQPWQAFILNATGSGFWSFSDTSRLDSNWNPYTNLFRYDYSPAYISPDSVTPAKQMEAIREGIQDYNYLVMLKASGREDAARSIAAGVTEGSSRMSGKRYWSQWKTDKTPCALADKARMDILDILEKK